MTSHKMNFLMQFPLHPIPEKPFNMEKKTRSLPTTPHSTQPNFRKWS
jgi:hypothetical protein